MNLSFCIRNIVTGHNQDAWRLVECLCELSPGIARAHFSQISASIPFFYVNTIKKQQFKHF